MSDLDFAEFERQYSPDGSKILLNYGIDLGAFGYGKVGYAILNLTDTTKNLRNFTLTEDLIKVKWLNNECISAKFDIIPYLRTNEKYVIKNQKINNVSILISPYDYIDPDYERVIEFKAKSPNNMFELVAYRYINENSGLNFIHVSVIQTGQEIPKYGNFLIADMHSDYVFDSMWTSQNKLIFYTNSLYADMVQYYLVKNRPKIDFQLKVDDERFGNKYRWMNKGSS
jgi:hypothetical protein